MTRENVLVKICGNTNAADIAHAARCGADFVGVIVGHPPSPRNVSQETARELRATARDAGCLFVLVTVNQSREKLLRLRDFLLPDVFQFHGDEPPELVRQLHADGARVWTAVGDATRARLMLQAGAEAVLVDARSQSEGTTVFGGTGRLSDWNLARQLADEGARVILAGGLNPENVAEAISSVHPWAVDAVSGVESGKGAKDHAKVAAFIAAAGGAGE